MTEEQITIKEILHVPIGRLATSEAEQLHKLLVEATENLERAKRTKQWIESAIGLKYEEQIKARRLSLEKDTGVVHLEDSGFKLTSEVTKKVEWDQQKLTKITANIVFNGGILGDYVESCYNVPEHKYNSWSEITKRMFEPARTVKLSRASYKLSKLDNEVVA